MFCIFSRCGLHRCSVMTRSRQHSCDRAPKISANQPRSCSTPLTSHRPLFSRLFIVRIHSEEGDRRSCLNDNAKCHILPAVGPQGPAARDSGSCAVQQSHTAFIRQPPVLQLACRYGNLPKHARPATG